MSNEVNNTNNKDQVKRHIGDEETLSIISELENNTHSSLDLAFCSIPHHHFSDIMLSLRENHSVKTLNLEGTCLIKDDILLLSMVLSHSKFITSVTLKGTLIGDTEATTLAVGLKDNNSLRSLDLSGNLIGSNGATNIAEALNGKYMLNFLDLSNNLILDKGITAIKDTLNSKALTLHITQEVQIENNSELSIEQNDIEPMGLDTQELVLDTIVV